MSFHNRAGAIARLSAVATVALSLTALASQANAQFLQQQVGGISIDARGVVSRVRVDELNDLKRMREAALRPVPGDLKAAALRKISLRQLEAAIAKNRADGVPLSDEMRYLAGMQRIQYVMVYPEHNDIVLAGPGEGWKLNDEAEVVGIRSNRPVLLLDDLLVALRSVDAANPAAILCSIDPTPEGLARLKSLMKKARIDGDDPQPVMTAYEQTLGPQTITVGGVPAASHFARVLVAADYRMKRIAMDFEESPIAALPSFLQMLKQSPKNAKTMLPRWWLEPNYDALVTDPERLTWEINGSVKALTEEETLNAAGQKQKAAHASPLAQKWAQAMTAHYDELSVEDSIFGQLRNCMDMAVVAALISKEQLGDKCGWAMPLLKNPELPTESYHSPTQVDSQASAVQKGSNWIISASGGVTINPFQPAENPKTDQRLQSVRAKSAAPGNHWWWN